MVFTILLLVVCGRLLTIYKKLLTKLLLCDIIKVQKTEARKMLAKILKNGGATINARGEFVQLKTGYQVSVRDLGRVKTSDLTEKMVRDVVEQGLQRGEYCGVWIDGGFAYVDISKRINTKQEAMRLGREKKQLSILDWRKNECLAVE